MNQFLRDIPKLHLASIVLSLVPILTVAVYIFVFGLNLPFWDQWEVIPLLVKAQQGKLLLSDLTAQHTVHRPAAPRVLWLILARLTHYNTNAELWLNFILALTTWWIFLRYTARFWRRQAVPQPTVYALTPILALLVFNLVQWESWLLGFQTVMYLAVLCVIAGFMALADKLTWRRLAAGMLVGVIATYSSSNALLYWPIGMALVLLYAPPTQRLVFGAAWLGAAGLVIASFVHGWSTHTSDLFAQLLSLSPLTYAHWMLNFLGAPLLAYPPAFLFGILSLILVVLVITSAWSARIMLRTGFYWAVIAFIVGSAGIIVLVRNYGGPAFALAPRYITQSTWYWASILALLPIVRMPSRLTMGLLVGIVILLTLSTLGGAFSGYKWRYLRSWPVYHAVRLGQPVSDEALFALYDDVPPSLVRERLNLLCEYKWSVCATQK